MTAYEYKVIPAPTRGRKGKGVKGAEARFAFAIQELMNQQATDGWAFQRAETLPSEERQGLRSATMVYRNLLVFRRPRTDQLEDFNPVLLEDQSDDPAPTQATTETKPQSETPADPDAQDPDPQNPETLRNRARDSLTPPD